jgi:hypothetical protein
VALMGIIDAKNGESIWLWCSCLLSSELECSCFLVLYFPMFFLVVAGFLLSLSVNVHGFFWAFCAEH